MQIRRSLVPLRACSKQAAKVVSSSSPFVPLVFPVFHRHYSTTIVNRIASASTSSTAVPKPFSGESGYLRTASDFARIAPMVLLQESLRQYTLLDGKEVASELGMSSSRVIIPRATFDKFCDAAHVPDSEAALETLSDAAILVSLAEGQLIHLRPVQYLQQYDIAEAIKQAASSEDATEAARCELPGLFLLGEQKRNVAALQAEEKKMREQLKPAIAKAARWRRSVWGGALLFAGAQLAIISRLTYFDLDWDIMEPVSYFVGIGTSLVFYLWYLRFNEEHTYTLFDQYYLPKRVRKYAPQDFDWVKYELVCAQLNTEQDILDTLREWAKTH